MSAKEGQCIHFNGVQHDECEAGVQYRAFKGRRPCIQFVARSVRGGTRLMPGEEPVSVVPWPWATPTHTCVHYQEATPEEIQEERKRYEAVIDKTLVAMRVVTGWRIKPKPAVDRKDVLECPICKGKLHVTQSSYNGHVHVSCETPNCVSWME